MSPTGTTMSAVSGIATSTAMPWFVMVGGERSRDTCEGDLADETAAFAGDDARGRRSQREALGDDAPTTR